MPDFSQLPSVEKLALALAEEVSLPRPLVTGFVKRALAQWRERLEQGENADRETIEGDVLSGLRIFATSRLQPVINATGVLIHTNLGRSPLGQRASDALAQVATGYSNLEFNLLDGKRGKRAGYLETALAVLLETEAATAVNNCAAALVLSLRTLISPEKTEVIVSRGELVEIGGGFRIPEARARTAAGDFGQVVDLDQLAARQAPAAFALQPNFPNPFNPATTIPYQLAVDAPVRLEVFDILGQKIKTLVAEKQPAGFHRAVWDSRDDGGRPVAAGVYFYRLQAGDFNRVSKLLLLK